MGFCQWLLITLATWEFWVQQLCSCDSRLQGSSDKRDSPAFLSSRGASQRLMVGHCRKQVAGQVEAPLMRSCWAFLLFQALLLLGQISVLCPEWSPSEAPVRCSVCASQSVQNAAGMAEGSCFGDHVKWLHWLPVCYWAQFKAW